MKEKETKTGTAMEPVQSPPILTKNKALVLKFKTQGADILAEARALQFTDDAKREQASELRIQAKRLVKDIDEKFDHARATAWTLYNLVKDGIVDMKADAERAVKILDPGMSAYDLKKKEAARIAQEKADREAEAIRQKEQDKLNAKAEKAEAKGNEDKAAELREQAENVPLAFVQSAVAAPQKTTRTESGTTSGSSDFDVIILEGMVVLRAVVAGTLEPGVVKVKKNEFNQITEMTITPTSIKKVAEMKVVGDVLPMIPGCRLVPKVSYGSRTGNGK